MRQHTAFDSFSDEELAAAAAKGAAENFEALVQRYGLRLFRYLRPKTVSDQEAEDLVQDTFRKAFQNIGNFDPEYRFATWLYTIAHRLAISVFRSRKSFAGVSDEPESGETGPEERLIRSEEAENVWAMARKLRGRQFESLWLRYGEDMDVKEIARVMRTSSAHVRVLLHRGRTGLAAAWRLHRQGECRAPSRKYSVL